MKNMINELWYGNIISQENGRNNLKEIKALLGYMGRHHGELKKGFADEGKGTLEKFHNCWGE